MLPKNVGVPFGYFGAGGAGPIPERCNLLFDLFSSCTPAFDFFTLGTCSEFNELKSDFQGWFFTASRREKKFIKSLLSTARKYFPSL